MQGRDVSPRHVVTTPVIGAYWWLQFQLREVHSFNLIYCTACGIKMRTRDFRSAWDLSGLGCQSPVGDCQCRDCDLSVTSDSGP